MTGRNPALTIGPVNPYRLVTDEPAELVTAEDLDRLTASIASVRRLVNDPVALIDRARRLLEGTAERLV